jgi:23S rRNA pseudouridine955/2504/2580 synthase
LAGRVVHCDDHIIVLDKPAGLAVQGGSQTIRHLDGMLDVLRFGGARPKLVHRLDRDTSGVLVLARTTATATALTRAFRTRAVRKLYWAVVVGVPKRPHGLIDLALAKTSSAGGEKMGAALDAKRRAVTRYRVVEAAGRRVAWLALEPLTGRTHQLRAHCAALGVPILGDGKYGGRAAFSLGNAVGRGLHLHAAAIVFPHPADGLFSAQAPLPQHMQQTWQQLGFSLRLADRETKRWIEETMTDPHRRCSQDHGDGSKAG